MNSALPDTRIVMHRIDPARNMARFYALSIEPTLFGDVAVVREWGRIGAGGQRRADHYTEAAAAGMALRKLAAGKVRRGYDTIEPKSRTTTIASGSRP